MTVQTIPNAAPEPQPLWQWFEDRAAEECVARGATTQLTRLAEPIRQSFLQTGTRQWGPDMIVSTSWRGYPELFFFDSKSQAQWRPGLSGLNWTIDDSAFIGMHSFRKAYQGLAWFGFLLMPYIGGSSPYIASLNDAAILSRYWGDDYRLINSLEAQLPTLDTLLGPRHPIWMPAPEPALNVIELPIAS